MVLFTVPSASAIIYTVSSFPVSSVSLSEFRRFPSWSFNSDLVSSASAFSASVSSVEASFSVVSSDTLSVDGFAAFTCHTP